MPDLECATCGRNDVVTPEGVEPQCYRHDPLRHKVQREFEADVTFVFMATDIEDACDKARALAIAGCEGSGLDPKTTGWNVAGRSGRGELG